uniref:Uncharacterized protein n=1 Tax=Fagus sylvatica TaxID=28930 RepID=A0A2N9HVQ5_FAGSY
MIHLVPNEKLWTPLQQDPVAPPPLLRKAGRPKMHRRRKPDEAPPYSLVQKIKHCKGEETSLRSWTMEAQNCNA